MQVLELQSQRLHVRFSNTLTLVRALLAFLPLVARFLRVGGERGGEALRAREPRGIEKVKQREELLEVVLQRRAREQAPPRAPQAQERLRQPRVLILEPVTLVDHHRAPAHRTKRRRVLHRHLVIGEHDVRETPAAAPAPSAAAEALARCGKVHLAKRFPGSRGAHVRHAVQSGAPGAQLGRPVRHRALRRDDEHRAGEEPEAPRAVAKRRRLDGLAETHLVPENRALATQELIQKPTNALELVRVQGQGGGRRARSARRQRRRLSGSRVRGGGFAARARRRAALEIGEPNAVAAEVARRRRRRSPPRDPRAVRAELRGEQRGDAVVHPRLVHLPEREALFLGRVGALVLRRHRRQRVPSRGGVFVLLVLLPLLLLVLLGRNAQAIVDRLLPNRPRLLHRLSPLKRAPPLGRPIRQEAPPRLPRALVVPQTAPLDERRVSVLALVHAPLRDDVLAHGGVRRHVRAELGRARARPVPAELARLPVPHRPQRHPPRAAVGFALELDQKLHRRVAARPGRGRLLLRRGRLVAVVAGARNHRRRGVAAGRASTGEHQVHLFVAEEVRRREVERGVFPPLLERRRLPPLLLLHARGAPPLAARDARELRPEAVHVVPRLAPVAQQKVRGVVPERTRRAQTFVVRRPVVVLVVPAAARRVGEIVRPRRRRAPRAPPRLRLFRLPRRRAHLAPPPRPPVGEGTRGARPRALVPRVQVVTPSRGGATPPRIRAARGRLLVVAVGGFFFFSAHGVVLPRSRGGGRVGLRARALLAPPLASRHAREFRAEAVGVPPGVAPVAQDEPRRVVALAADLARGRLGEPDAFAAAARGGGVFGGIGGRRDMREEGSERGGIGGGGLRRVRRGISGLHDPKVRVIRVADAAVVVRGVGHRVVRRLHRAFARGGSPNARGTTKDRERRPQGRSTPPGEVRRTGCQDRTEGASFFVVVSDRARRASNGAPGRTPFASRGPRGDACARACPPAAPPDARGRTARHSARPTPREDREECARAPGFPLDETMFCKSCARRRAQLGSFTLNHAGSDEGSVQVLFGFGVWVAPSSLTSPRRPPARPPAAPCARRP